MDGARLIQPGHVPLLGIRVLALGRPDHTAAELEDAGADVFGFDPADPGGAGVGSALEDLIRNTDVLLVGLQASLLERHGISARRLLEINPGLVALHGPVGDGTEGALRVVLGLYCRDACCGAGQVIHAR
jgi:hypothetical protein